MNLLELMLKEEVEWPVGADGVVQDGDKCLYFYSGDGIPFMHEGAASWSPNGGFIRNTMTCLCDLSCDWSNRIITREEYQAAGGWMKWELGNRPVDLGVVETRWSDGDKQKIEYDEDWHCRVESGDPNITAYRIIKPEAVQLDNPEIESGFEPFVSIEDAQECKAEHAITPSKYTKLIHGVSVDVYDVLTAWGVTNPALQHLIKKALQCGQRGHKDKQQDLQDIIDSAIRAQELER